MTSCYLLDINSYPFPSLLKGRLALLPITDLEPNFPREAALLPNPHLEDVPDLVSGRADRTRNPDCVAVFIFDGETADWSDVIGDLRPVTAHALVLPLGSYVFPVPGSRREFLCQLHSVQDPPLVLLHEFLNQEIRSDHFWLDWPVTVLTEWSVRDHIRQTGMYCLHGTDALQVDYATSVLLNGRSPEVVYHHPDFRQNALHSYGIYGAVVEEVRSLGALPLGHFFYEQPHDLIWRP